MFTGENKLLTDLRELLSRQNDIRLSIVYGSVADGRETAESDLDIAVLADRPLTPERKIALIDALADISGRPIDLIDLCTAGEPLLGRILQQGTRLTGSNSTWATLVSKHLFDAADFLPYRNRMLRERREAWIKQ
jgi:uncharacterized protein